MKKMLAFLAALVLLCCGCALAEGTSADAAGKAFDSKWVNENTSVEINLEDDGYRVMIVRTDEYPQATCWEYSAVYVPETGKLAAVPLGRKSSVTYTEDGTFSFGETLYEDGEAEFSLTEAGRLVWKDMKEDAGKDAEFEKIGWFDGSVWVCDRARIEMDWEEEGYRVYVEWSSNAWESTVWMYSCFYDAATNSMSGFGSCENLEYDDDGNVISSGVVYEDGEVTFTLTEEGKLLWKDAKEDAGKDMQFERMEY